MESQEVGAGRETHLPGASYLTDSDRRLTALRDRREHGHSFRFPAGLQSPFRRVGRPDAEGEAAAERFCQS